MARQQPIRPYGVLNFADRMRGAGPGCRRPQTGVHEQRAKFRSCFSIPAEEVMFPQQADVVSVQLLVTGITKERRETLAC